MEYVSLGKGGLLTILIPLNFLIGEYTLFFKQNGKKRGKLHCVVVVLIAAAVVRLLFPFMFLDLPIWDRWISYVILLSLSFELIVFNCLMIKKYRGETLCQK